MNNVILKKILRRQFQCEHSSHDRTRIETYIRERADISSQLEIMLYRRIEYRTILHSGKNILIS